MAKQYIVYKKDGVIWREGVRDGNFMTDVALTITAFAGDENVDWINTQEIVKPE